tara:strand:+ start:58 stop:558 length:501 start_codon:yes stop_codon:yes gene_type:complete
MSVTINGDGTVTGLAALPNTAMASSTVIQAACSSANDLSQVNTSSNDYSDITGCDLLFTPKFSTSTIILAVNYHVNTGAANRNASVRLTFNHSGINQTALSTTQDGYSINNAPGAIDTYGTLFYNQPNVSTTNEITYRLQMRSVGGSGTIYINRKPIRIMAWEIKV